MADSPRSLKTLTETTALFHLRSVFVTSLESALGRSGSSSRRLIPEVAVTRDGLMLRFKSISVPGISASVKIEHVQNLVCSIESIKKLLLDRIRPLADGNVRFGVTHYGNCIVLKFSVSNIYFTLDPSMFYLKDPSVNGHQWYLLESFTVYEEPETNRPFNAKTDSMYDFFKI